MTKSKPNFETMTEDELVAAVAVAVNSHWLVGEGADAWTRRHSAGRTDQAFGLLVGLSGETIRQARNVWSKFKDLQQLRLQWSHFYAAMNWDDAEEWLRSAADNRWSVRAMREERARLQAAMETDEEETDDGEETDVGLPGPEEMPAEAPDVEALKKKLLKALRKFRLEFRGSLDVMADELANFEEGLRQAMEPANR